MVIVLIVGLTGEGKTFLMTYLLKQAHIKKRLVYSNYNLTFGETFNPADIINLKLNNCAMGLDEAYVIMDSRNSLNDLNKYWSYFIVQSRKRDVDIYLTSQLGGMIDLRARYNAHFVILSNKGKTGFKYTMFNQGYKVKSFNIPFSIAKNYYKYYDTKEVITPLNVNSRVDFDLIEEYFKDSPTKKAFITLTRKTYPYISLEDFASTYDFIKIEKKDRAKQILGLIGV